MQTTLLNLKRDPNSEDYPCSTHKGTLTDPSKPANLENYPYSAHK